MNKIGISRKNLGQETENSLKIEDQYQGSRVLPTSRVRLLRR